MKPNFPDLLIRLCLLPQQKNCIDYPITSIVKINLSKTQTQGSLSKQKSPSVISNLDQVRSSTSIDVSTSVRPSHNFNKLITLDRTLSLSIDNSSNSSNMDKLEKNIYESNVSEQPIQQQTESIVSEPPNQEK